MNDFIDDKNFEAEKVTFEFDDAACEAELLDLPPHGKPTARKRQLETLLEALLAQHSGTAELAGKYAVAMAAVAKNIREDITMNEKLRVHEDKKAREAAEMSEDLNEAEKQKLAEEIEAMMFPDDGELA